MCDQLQDESRLPSPSNDSFKGQDGKPCSPGCCQHSALKFCYFPFPGSLRCNHNVLVRPPRSACAIRDVFCSVTAVRKGLSMPTTCLCSSFCTDPGFASSHPIASLERWNKQKEFLWCFLAPLRVCFLPFQISTALSQDVPEPVQSKVGAHSTIWFAVFHCYRPIMQQK